MADNITMWEAWINDDDIEGRGEMRLVARFMNECDAETFAKGRNPVGYRVCPVVVFSTLDAYQDAYNDEIRRQALNRLTTEERRVLGLVQ